MLSRTWLVQRLGVPPKKTGGPFDKAHRVFGGGMLGLAKETWDVVDEVFDIDYMGAAEYEFGIFPKTMDALVQCAKREELTAFSIEVKRKDIAKNSGRRWVADDKEPPPKPKGPATIYIVCRTADATEVEERVRGLVAGKVDVRDGTRIECALDPVNEWDGKIRGWLELNNKFLFFTDETMWNGVRQWFALLGEPALPTR
jgi:hypothetical protein